MKGLRVDDARKLTPARRPKADLLAAIFRPILRCVPGRNATGNTVLQRVGIAFQRDPLGVVHDHRTDITLGDPWLETALDFTGW